METIRATGVICGLSITSKCSFRTEDLFGGDLSSLERSTVTVTGIIRAVAPSRPLIADWRSWLKEPTVSVVLMILNAFSGEGSVASTSALVIGMETGPN